MNITFEGKHALVTGAGRGFGRSIATDLYNAGATVYALSKTQANLDSLKQELPDIHIVLVDLSDWDATRRVVRECGPIDLLVNNAGTLTEDCPATVSESLIDHTFAVNLKAPINVTQVVAEGMIERGTGGSIVNVSSLASKVAATKMFAYSLSKIALDHSTRMFAVELGKHKIRVNSVNPTAVMTDMGKEFWNSEERMKLLDDAIPMEGIPVVQDVTNAVLYLLSDKSNFITGETICVDGGWGAK